MAFTINGSGIALQVDFSFSFILMLSQLYFHVMQDAQANGLVASLRYQAEAKMGILHAAIVNFLPTMVSIRSFITLGLGAHLSLLLSSPSFDIGHSIILSCSELPLAILSSFALSLELKLLTVG